MIWIMQGGLDFLLLVLALLLWWSQKSSQSDPLPNNEEQIKLALRDAEDRISSALRSIEERFNSTLHTVESKVKEFDQEASDWRKRLDVERDRQVAQFHEELERQTAKYRQRLESELATLNRICERARTILSQGQAAFPPSDEEYELKAALSVERSEPEKSTIPTLHQLEKTKQRLKSDISVDLRSLLKDQLV